MAPASLSDPDVHGSEVAQIQVDLVEVGRLLDELATIDERSAEIVEMRYFAGLTIPEVAGATGLSERTVKRSWQFARAWLHGRLDAHAAPGS